MTDYLAVARKDPPLSAAIIIASIGVLTMAATDSYRLAVKETALTRPLLGL